MFEYLMPEIFHALAAGNAASAESDRAVTRLQRRLGVALERPWGVSESGYYAFDMHLNYQYRAFGLREVALGGGARESVVAPYASVLAVGVCPDEGGRQRAGHAPLRLDGRAWVFRGRGL